MTGNDVPLLRTDDDRESGVGAVDKALDVLFHLHHSGPQGVTSVARALGLPKSTAHRLLTVLTRRGLLEKTPQSLYRPGFTLVALGYGILDGDPIVAAVRRPLEEAAVALGETCFFVGAHGGELVVLHKEEGRGILRAAPSVGSRVPLHATSAGRLYLAFAPELVRLPRRLEPYTDKTPHDHAALEEAVARAREHGWELNEEGWIRGLSVLSAAVLSRGKMLGVVSLAAAAPRMEALGGAALAPRVIEVAEAIAKRIEGEQ
ncbi:MAG: IclR family transcriptional regulator [Polyangiaceae bacterium]|nr:IclR family transcriptional regulator [Polyangiaceae bacterium]